MKRYRINRWLWCPLLAVSVAGAWWALAVGSGSGSRQKAPAATAPADCSCFAASDLPGVICFGYVDVLPGITSLFPTYPGRVSEATVAEGEEVSAGAVLVRLEDRLPQARLDEAKAVVEAARAQLAQAREAAQQHQARIAQLQAAIEALEHRQSAAELQRGYYDDLRGQFSEKDLNVARENVKEVAALLKAEREKLKELLLHDPTVGVRRAEAEVNVMQARLAQAQEALEQCTIRAPSAGTVLRVLVKPGDMLGTAARDPAVQFCPKGLRLVRAEVDQEFAGSLTVGGKAAIQDDTKSGPTWQGKVIRISDWYTQRRSIIQEPLQVNDVRTLECLITLDPGQPHLRIGQRVRVRIGATKD